MMDQFVITLKPQGPQCNLPKKNRTENYQSGKNYNFDAGRI